MDLIEILIRQYSIDKNRALALVKNKLVKINGKYISSSKYTGGEITVPSSLLTIGMDFFDLYEIAIKYSSLFNYIKGIVFFSANESEMYFFNLINKKNGKYSPYMVYMSNVYPLDVPKRIKGSYAFIVKYINDYKDFSFKKNLLKEIAKENHYSLVDVFLSQYSSNRYIIYEKERGKI